MRRLRLRLLQWQIGPHFLSNTLTAIQAFVRAQPALAEDLLGTLAQFARMLVGWGDRPVTVAEEAAFVRVYLGLQRVRLGLRLRTRFDIDPRTHGLPIPPLLLQPLVENAVTHAAAVRSEGATLRLAVRYACRRRFLLLGVSDDGPGLRRDGARMTAQSLSAGSGPGPGSHQGVGLQNLRLRLALAYGKGARLRLLAPPGGGVIATLVLPLSRRARPGSRDDGADACR